MPHVVVRHATAGDPAAWIGNDRARPLDEPGRKQADALVGLLEPYPLDRVLTSPYLRCVQTVEPLARARALPLEYRHELGEDASADEVLALIRGLGEARAVLCSHGDLIAELLGEELEKGAFAAVDVTPAGLVALARR